MKRLDFAILGLAIVPLSACAAPSTTQPEPTAPSAPATEAVAAPTHSNVPYVDDGNPKHTLDIYLPDVAEGTVPTLFFIHGDGDEKEHHQAVASYFADKGYAAVLTDYRYPNESSRPLMLEDAFCSLAWVHANANTYGFDPDRIVVFGYSLGGLIAADVGVIDEPISLMAQCPHELPAIPLVQGVATFAALLGTPEICMQESWCMSGAGSGNSIPLTLMLSIFESLRDLPPSDWRDNPQLSEEATSFAQTLPAYWIDGSEPAFLLIHGSDDDRIPPAESEAFAARLQSAGVDTELVLISGAGHQSIYPASPSFIIIVEAVEAFLAGS